MDTLLRAWTPLPIQFLKTNQKLGLIQISDTFVTAIVCLLKNHISFSILQLILIFCVLSQIIYNEEG